MQCRGLARPWGWPASWRRTWRRAGGSRGSPHTSPPPSLSPSSGRIHPSSVGQSHTWYSTNMHPLVQPEGGGTEGAPPPSFISHFGLGHRSQKRHNIFDTWANVMFNPSYYKYLRPPQNHLAAPLLKRNTSIWVRRFQPDKTINMLVVQFVRMARRNILSYVWSRQIHACFLLDFSLGQTFSPLDKRNSSEWKQIALRGLKN